MLEANQSSKKNFLIRAETLEVMHGCDGSSTVTEGLNKNDAIAELIYDEPDLEGKTNLAEIKKAYANGFSKRNCTDGEPCTVVNCPFQNGTQPSYNCFNVDKFKLLVPTPEDKLPVFNSNWSAENATFFFNFGFDSIEITSTVNGRNFLVPNISLQTEPDEKDKLTLCSNVSETCKKEDCQCTQILDLGEEFYNKSIRWEMVIIMPF